MIKHDIKFFYDEFVEQQPENEANYIGHFDLLHWDDLKNDVSACERLQRKPFYKIALLDGDAVYGCNNIEVPITGHAIVFTDPLTRSSFATEDNNFKGRYCIATESFFKGTAKINLRNWPVFRDRSVFVKQLTKTEYLQLLDIFESIEIENQSNYPYKEQLIRNRLFDIIHFVQKALPIEKNKVERDENSLDELFFNKLERAFFSITPQYPLSGKSPAHFAELLHCTVDQLNNAMKKVAGKSTQQIIHERIIEEADFFIRTSDYSIKEISWMLHFQEAAHFINFYKKHTDRTPMAYRLA